MTASDDDRITWLAGDAVDSLNADERAQLDESREMLRAPATWAEPGRGLEDLVVDAIAAEAGTRTTQAEIRAHAPATRTVKPAARRARFWQRLRIRRPALRFGTLAGSVVAVAVAILIASASRTPAPLHFAMVVSGSPLAPGAHGSASLTRSGSGWRIELSATGLLHLENGRYYEAWLTNAAGILVPVGTFNDAVHVILWSGVPVTRFRTLTVTQQLVGGNPVSSGRRVLVGRIASSG